MYSKARIAKHPIHPMLVAFPTVLYVLTTAALAACWITGDAFYERVAFDANVAGIALALVAAVPGAIDLFVLPRDTAPRVTGARHGRLAMFATLLYSCAAVLQYEGFDVRAALVAAGLGVLVLGRVAFLGWTMVQTHKVGVTPNHLRSIPNREPRSIAS